MGIPREKLVVVSIMPCLAKKYECDREEFKTDGNPDVDYSISCLLYTSQGMMDTTTSFSRGMPIFFEHHFPDMLDIPSTARSPQQMFGSIAKTFWAKKMGIPREKLLVVSIMPCLAKKYECDREEFKTDGNPDVDYSCLLYTSDISPASAPPAITSDMKRSPVRPSR